MFSTYWNESIINLFETIISARNLGSEEFNEGGYDSDFFLNVRLSQLSTEEQQAAAGLLQAVTPNPTVASAIPTSIRTISAPAASGGGNFEDPTYSTEYFNNAIVEIEKGTEQLPFDTSRCSEIKEWSANTEKYDTNKARIYYKWLRTIAEFGGEKLGKLGHLELEDEFGEKIPLLISFLRGERTKYKYKVLDQCLKFIPLHWKKADGEPYEPSSITTYGKYISSILKQENVQYSVESEF